MSSLPEPVDAPQVLQVEGVPVFVEGTGCGTLLMVHGWPDTHRLWDGTVAALRGDFRCCRFTLPGFDEGTGRIEPGLDDILRLLERIADAVSPHRPVTLVLHDWGCLFGYQFALRHPQRVARIVAVDVGDPAGLAATLPRTQLLGIAGYQLWLALAWRIGGPLGGGMTRWIARTLRVPRPGRINVRMNWPYHLAWFGGARSLRRTSLPWRLAWPMLYVWGRRKPFMFHAPGWPDAVAARPGSAALPFDTSHWVMLDDPARFHAVVRDGLLKGGKG